MTQKTLGNNQDYIASNQLESLASVNKLLADMSVLKKANPSKVDHNSAIRDAGNSPNADYDNLRRALAESIKQNMKTPKKAAYSNPIPNELQRWLGTVTNIEAHKFTARLKDLDDPTTDEVAEFSIMDVSFVDTALLKKGACFYWNVGYANEKGQVMKKSFIKFRRLPVFTDDEFDNLVDNADVTSKVIIWD